MDYHCGVVQMVDAEQLQTLGWSVQQIRRLHVLARTYRYGGQVLFDTRDVASVRATPGFRPVSGPQEGHCDDCEDPVF